MDLKGIMLSEISQREKEKCYMISFICEIKKQQTSYRHREKTGGCQKWGVGVYKTGRGGQKAQSSSYKLNKS